MKNPVVTDLFRGKIMSFYYEQILNISQAIGLRDLDSGCSLSLFRFIEVGCSGNRGKRASSSSSSRPVWCHDCNRGQHPASKRRELE